MGVLDALRAATIVRSISDQALLGFGLYRSSSDRYLPRRSLDRYALVKPLRASCQSSSSVKSRAAWMAAKFALM